MVRAGDTFGERCLFLASPLAVTLRGCHVNAKGAGGEGEEEREAQEREGGDQRSGDVLLLPRHAMKLLFDAHPQVHTHTLSLALSRTHTPVGINVVGSWVKRRVFHGDPCLGFDSTRSTRVCGRRT